MAPLTTERRKTLPKSSFVFPDKAPGPGSYPIPDIEHGRNALSRAAGKPEESAVKAAVYRRYPQLKKYEVTKISKLWKNEEQHLIYGVVMEPDLEDSQGDIISIDEIQKTAHHYLLESRKQDVQHSNEVAPVEPVESYIAPCDMEVAGEPVQKGAWVLVCKVNDEQIWQDVLDGKLTGYSIGGMGIRTEIAA